MLLVYYTTFIQIIECETKTRNLRNPIDIINFILFLAMLGLMIAIRIINLKCCLRGRVIPIELTWELGFKLTLTLQISTSVAHTYTLINDDTKVPLTLLKIS